VIDNDHDRMSKDYLKCLVLPQYCGARIPDSFATSTALAKSVQIVNVSAYNSTVTADTGRFAVAVQPTLGSLNGPLNYKTALVNASGGTWPTTLTQPASFVSSNNGMDIRTDPYTRILTQPQLATVELYGDLASSTAALPFGNFVTANSGYGLDVTYAQVGTNSGFYPPPGFYSVTFQMTNPDGANGDLQITVDPIGDATVLQKFNGVNVNGETSSWTGYVNIPSTRPAGGNGVFIFVNALSTPPPNVMRAYFTVTYDDIPGITQNNGIIQKYRPVACSALLTYTGPPLTGGGDVAAALVPGNTLATQFFTQSVSQDQGNIAAWQNLSGVKGSYNGPLTDGAYVWYSPESNLDYSMRTPDEAVNYAFPSIVIAGQYSPGTTFTSGQIIARLEIHTVYEILTDSILLESRYQAGSQAIMDSVLNHLAGQDHAMKNKTHVTFGNKVLNAFKSAGSWLWANRKPIGSAVSSLASLV